MRVLFEAQDLEEASPATVSRCGIIYLDETIIHHTSLFKTLCKKEIGDMLTPKMHEILIELYDKSFELL